MNEIPAVIVGGVIVITTQIVIAVFSARRETRAFRRERQRLRLDEVRRLYIDALNALLLFVSEFASMSNPNEMMKDQAACLAALSLSSPREIEQQFRVAMKRTAVAYSHDDVPYKNKAARWKYALDKGYLTPSFEAIDRMKELMKQHLKALETKL